MANFWEDVVNSSLQGRDINQAWRDLSNEASFRPSVYIGLGGFGCGVIRELKKEISALIPDQRIRDGFAFMGFDTHTRDRNDVLTQREYFGNLSIGIVPNQVARDPSHGLGWFLDLAKKWEARTIQDGANKIRSVGRLALLYPPTLNEFFAGLTSALDAVNTFRTNFGVAASPKVYVISSLAGGTGSGMLLDIVFITAQYLMSQYGANYQFHAILATPEALEGEAKRMDFPDFYANTYATLQEMFHFITGNDELVSYRVEGQNFNPLRVSVMHIPHTIYLITDRNASGKIVTEAFEDLEEFAVSYLLSEIQTPLEVSAGQPKPQDGENALFSDPGHGNMPRALSSFGVVRFGLPYNEIEELFALSLVHGAINDDLCGYVGNGTPDNWITDNGLAESGSDQLQESIRKDKEGKSIRIAIDTQGKLDEVKRTELEKSCKALKEQMKLSIHDQYSPILEANGKNIMEKARTNLQASFDSMMSEKTLASALAFLESIMERLKTHKEALSQELNANNAKLQKASDKVDQAIKSLVDAAKSGWHKRNDRINAAIGTLDGDLEAYLNHQILVWSQGRGLSVYDGLISSCQGLSAPWVDIRDGLKGRLSSVEKKSREISLEIDKMADINKRGSGNRFSLIDTRKAWSLYKEYIDAEAEKAISLRTRRTWREKGIITDLTSSDDEWIRRAKEGIGEEVRSKIQQLSLIAIIDKFYSDVRARDELFTAIIALGSPLYPLDPNKREPQYSEDYVVAVHPSIRDSFLDLFGMYSPQGAGMGHAYFSTVYEVIIYSISRGYTAHSLTRLNTYKTSYDRLQSGYEKALAQRPIHSWPETGDWDEVTPPPIGEEEAYRWFIVGRAFSSLFPSVAKADGKPDERKNEAFIFGRGNNYYMIVADGEKPQRIGDSISAAVMNFENRPDWQRRIRELVESKIEELGKAHIRDRIINEYVPIVDNEIRTTERSRDPERAKILRELLKALNKFIREYLAERGV